MPLSGAGERVTSVFHSPSGDALSIHSMHSAPPNASWDMRASLIAAFGLGDGESATVSGRV